MAEADNIKILIVDDEADIIEFLSYNLKKEGYLIETAVDGNDGYNKSVAFKPDLILLDIMMPNMDGIELCGKLREEEVFNDTIIAFLTARGESFTHVAALDTGGDDFITKPIKPSVLKARIKALLRRKGRTVDSGTVLKFGDLTIDIDSFSVILGDKQVNLPKKEFELLKLLVSKPEKVFKREEILSKVWGSEVLVGDRTIDVHIRKLREKIGSHYIKTLKGVGYKFVY